MNIGGLQAGTFMAPVKFPKIGTPAPPSAPTSPTLAALPPFESLSIDFTRLVPAAPAAPSVPVEIAVDKPQAPAQPSTQVQVAADGTRFQEAGNGTLLMTDFAPTSVTAFIDGADRNDSLLGGFRMQDMEGLSVGQFHELGQLASSGDIKLAGSVARTGQTAEAKLGAAKKLKLAKLGVTLGLTLAGCAVGMPFLGAGIGILGGIITDKFSRGAAQKLEIASGLQSALAPGETWKGSKTFATDAAGQLTETGANSSIQKMSAEQLRDDLIASRQANPEGMAVSFVSGHGVAGHLLAGMPLDKVGKAYADVRQATGKQTDLGVFFSCGLGNVESLSFLGDNVKVAVVSQDAIDLSIQDRSAAGIRAQAGGFVSQGMAEALKNHHNPRSAAQQMVSDIVGAGKAQTMTAVDLEAYQKDFMPAFSKLNEQLLTEGIVGKGPAIRAAFEQSTMQGDKDKIDLSRFLDNLSQAGLSATAQEHLDAARAASQAMILANASSTEGSSGLSLYRTPHFMFDAPESGLKRTAQKLGGLGEVSTLQSSGMPESWTQVRDIYGQPAKS